MKYKYNNRYDQVWNTMRERAFYQENVRKLKRENALMRRWLPMFMEACGKDKAWQEVMSEMSRKMPGLFVKGTRK